MADANNTNQTATEQRPQRTMAMTMRTSASGALQPTTLAEAMDVAKLIAYSGMVPKQFEEKPGAVLIAMQMGAEIGLSPMASLQNIAVVNGRPTVWGDAMLAIVTSHPECLDVVETEGDGWAKCIVKRRGRTPIERIFTIDDAKRANLWGKQGPWSQYPKRMMQMRARGFSLRDAFPDALRGIVSTEEARDYAIDATAEFSEPTAIPEGTHKFGFGKTSEPPHDATTGEVIESPTHVEADRAVETKARPQPATRKTKAEPVAPPRPAPVEGASNEERERAFREKYQATSAQDDAEYLAEQARVAEAEMAGYPEPGSEG